MTISIDKIVDGFPHHPNIAPIVGIPTYESIAELNLQLKANAASVQSNLGDGQLLGLLALTVSPAVFNTLRALSTVGLRRSDFKDLDETHSLKALFIPNLSKY
jgi:hypothetical protein